jgi:CBS domain-containing protein
MVDARRRSGITARDLLRHPGESVAEAQSVPTQPGPVPASTSLEEILKLLRAAAADAIDVVDDEGRLEGTITREHALGALVRAVEEMSEERRVLELAVERQRLALDDLAERLGRIHEALDLAEELRRGSSDPSPVLERVLAQIRRDLGEPRRG